MPFYSIYQSSHSFIISISKYLLSIFVSVFIYLSIITLNQFKSTFLFHRFARDNVYNFIKFCRDLQVKKGVITDGLTDARTDNTFGVGNSPVKKKLWTFGGLCTYDLSLHLRHSYDQPFSLTLSYTQNIRPSVTLKAWQWSFF